MDIVNMAGPENNEIICGQADKSSQLTMIDLNIRLSSKGRLIPKW